MIITGHLDPLNLSLHINAFSPRSKDKIYNKRSSGLDPFPLVIRNTPAYCYKPADTYINQSPASRLHF